MGRAVSIPPLNMTPEELAKALLRSVGKDLEGDSENQGKHKASGVSRSDVQDSLKRDSADEVMNI